MIISNTSNLDLTLGRLIIVDDDEALLKALCEMLADKGYDTLGMTSASEALEALKEESQTNQR